MIHKRKTYRRHQRERVIKNRTSLMKQLEWDRDLRELREPNRLFKHKPYESCGSDHCYICNSRHEEPSWKRIKQNRIAQMDLEEFNKSIEVGEKEFNE